MGRYRTDVVQSCGSSQQCWDATTYNGYNCQRTCLPSQGTCVFQMSGGLGGCGTCGPGTGACCQWLAPAGVSSVIIEIWGGGGGGGASPNCLCVQQGGGGGGGSYSRKTLAIAAGQYYTICVGSGGAGGGLCGGLSVPQACCCGNKGGTTYITGPGLCNFCAEGGYGGESRIGANCMNAFSPNGGWPGTGGDLNSRGGDGGVAGGSNDDWRNGYSWGGSSPFGGKNVFLGYDFCSQYTDQCGNGIGGGVNGFVGSFPGGGGTGGFASCCCFIPACGGNGAPGAIRIWM